MGSEMTVGKLIEILSAYDKDAAVYFGADMSNFKCECDRCNHSQNCEFNDWLEYDSIQTSKQAYKGHNGYATRDVIEISLTY